MIPNALNTSRFAEYIDAIKMLYKIDDEFKSLCDDYVTSKTRLEKEKEKSIAEKQRTLEYIRLTQDLEKEILDYVSKLS